MRDGWRGRIAVTPAPWYFLGSLLEVRVSCGSADRG